MLSCEKLNNNVEESNQNVMIISNNKKINNEIQDEKGQTEKGQIEKENKKKENYIRLDDLDFYEALKLDKRDFGLMLKDNIFNDIHVLGICIQNDFLITNIIKVSFVLFYIDLFLFFNASKLFSLLL